MFNAHLFSERIKQARLNKKLSQAELAAMVGVAPATISSYEKISAPKIPTLDKAQEIAQALEVSLDWLSGSETRIQNNTNYFECLFSVLVNSDFFIRPYVFDNTVPDYTFEISGTNRIISGFLEEYVRILPIICDDNVPEYLRTGLIDTMLNKFGSVSPYEGGANNGSNNPT